MRVPHEMLPHVWPAIRGHRLTWARAKSASTALGFGRLSERNKRRVFDSCADALLEVLRRHLGDNGWWLQGIDRRGGRWYVMLVEGTWKPVSELLQSREVSHGRAA